MEVIDLDESFCERILQAHQKDEKIKVLEIKKELATSKGDNYLSDIYRVLVKYNKHENSNPKNTEETSFIVKIKLPLLGCAAETLNEAFRNEIYVFTKVLPRIEKYIGCPVSPFLFYVDKNSNYIVMEDLKKSGYKIEDRKKGLSFEHCLIAVEQMAKFHAGSVAVAEREPEITKDFNGLCGFTKFPENYYKFVKSNLESLSKNIGEKWKDEEYQEIACKLSKFTHNLNMRISSIFEYDADEFCVLNHGDFWTNNVMFKHNEKGQPCNALLVDYQLISYTSPAIDLIHFLSMCPEMDIMGAKDDYILETYLRILKDTMKKIGCKTNPPTFEELKSSMIKRRFYSILTCLIYLPRILLDEKDVLSFTEVMDTGDSVDIFNFPASVKMIKKNSKSLNEKGFLDEQSMDAYFEKSSDSLIL